MHKSIKLYDGITTDHQIELIDGSHALKNGFNTRVIITAKNCNKVGTEIEITENQTALSGRTKLLEDNFDIIPDMNQHIFINDNILGEFNELTGEKAASAISAHNTPLNIMPRNNLKLFVKRKVAYWCAGNGATNKTVLSQSYGPHKTNTRLYNILPFRFIKVSEKLKDEERENYKCEVIYPSTSKFYGYKGYYFKKVIYKTGTNGINMKVNESDYIPKPGDTAPDLNAPPSLPNGYVNTFKNNKLQLNYIDINLNVSSEEFKEFFIFLDGTEINASISEIGLITGLTGVIKDNTTLIPLNELTSDDENLKKSAEVYDAELFSHLTFDPYSVGRKNNTIDFEYRIFS